MQVAAAQGGGSVQQRRVAGHHIQVARLDAVALGDLRQQAGRGQAAAAGVVGHVGTEKQRIHAPALGAELAQQLGVDGVERAGIEQAAAQAGLVAGHHRVPARAVELGHGLQRTGQGLPLVGVAEVVIAQGVERAVAVEDGDFHHADYSLGAGTGCQAVM